MKKKIYTEKQINYSRIAGERIKAFRIARGWTQEKCAEEWGFGDEISIRRFEGNAKDPKPGKVYYPVSKNSALKIQDKTGIHFKYWMGEAPTQTAADYLEWQREQCDLAQHENASLEAEAELRETEQMHIKMMHDFFFMCGYDYQYLEGAKYDFASVSQNPGEELIYASTHRHRLTSFNEPDKHYYFNKTELEALITELRETIAFTCFKKDRNIQTDITSSVTK